MADIDFSRLGVNVTSLNPVELIIGASMIILLELIQVVQERNGSVRELINLRPIWFRWAAYYGIIILIAVLGMFKSEAFIYFQF